jgi:hypothetical protein
MTCCDHGYGRPSWRPRVFLRQAQDRLPLRRTVKVRLGTNTLRLPGGTPILFALAALRSVPQAGSQFRGLATAMHKISWLTHWFTEIARVAWEPCGD